MTGPDRNAETSQQRIESVVAQWTRCVDRADAATESRWGELAQAADPRAWRRRWLDELSANTDQYLRSPAFLRMMQSHIEALVQARDAAAPKAATQTPSPPPARDPQALGATPYEVVFEQGTLRLLRYRNAAAAFAEPILVCFALVNRPYVLDLRGDRSVVQQLVSAGFNTYLIDWGSPTPEDQGLRLADYVCGFLKHAVDFVCEHAGASQLNLLGYCMGGAMASMFTALYPDRVRNLILMAAPIDYSGADGLLNLWAREDYFDVDRLIDAFGNCPGEFLRYCFQLLKPVQNLTEKYLALCERLDDDAFLDNFFALQRWANDSIPVAGETFREYVKLLYQQNQLIQGRLRLNGARVRLEAITCPLLLLVAEHDHLVPPSSTLKIREVVGSKDIESLSIDAGHIGLAVSSKAHRRMWPEAIQWIARHSTRINP